MKKYYSFRVYIWENIRNNEMFKDIVEANKDRINDYITVFVFNKFDDMYKTVREIEGKIEFNGRNSLENDYAGRTLMCRHQLYNDDNPDKVWGYSKSQGFIYLCDEDGLTFNTVSHEVGHAVIGYMGAYFKDKFKFTTYTEDKNDEAMLYEELFCYITGSLNNQICVKF